MKQIIALVRVQHGLEGPHCFLAHLEKVGKNFLTIGAIYPGLELIWSTFFTIMSFTVLHKTARIVKLS